MNTTQKTNEEIADKCIFRAYSEHTPEIKDKILREKLVEALNTKDREKDEAVAEAVKAERKRIFTKLVCDVCDGSGSHATPSDYGPCSRCDGTGINSINFVCLKDLFDELEIEDKPLTTPNQKDHE